jgi:hypothetical protein
VGRCPPDRRLNPKPLLAALLLACAACAAPPVAPTVPEGVAARLTTALRQHSRDDFLAVFADDPDDQAVGLSWYAVLDAGDATLTEVGGDVLAASYRLDGDRTQATERVAYDLADGTNRIDAAGAVDGVLPLWAIGGVSLTATSGGTLVSAALDATARAAWARRLDRAEAIVRAAGVSEEAWPGGIVVEVPPQGRFEQVSGASATSASAITVCAAGTPRIILNPAVLGQPEAWLDSTLVHEAVHAATDSACAEPGSSLDWVVEGLAESVAARSDADTASRNRQLVRAYLKAHGLPDALPQSLQTLTDYALAQLAVDAVRVRLGDRADEFWERAIHRASAVTSADLDRATAWYRAALTKLAG